MSTRRIFLCLICLFSVSPVKAGEVAANWHQWRGPEATGVSRTATPPLMWSDTENVQWKAEIEGQGGSSPIVWGDQVFLSTAVNTGKVNPEKVAPESQTHENPFGIKYPNTFYEFVVLCLDRATGETIWRKVATTQVPVEGHHHDNDYASSSPTTDGERLYVWFGSAGLYCYSLGGEFLWSRDLGPAKTRLSFGEGSSPVVYDGRLILTRDQEEQSYITVMDAKTGKTLWRKERDEPSCWATPIVVAHGDTKQVITNAHNRVRSYDLADGKLLWECGGQVSNVTPSPVSDGTTVFCMSGYRGASVMALPLDALGDISGTDRIRWQRDQGTPYVPSPILYDDFLYFNQSNNAILTCVNAKSGEILIERTRMPNVRGIYASPVGAQDRVYYVGRDGVTLVLKKGGTFDVLATNILNDQIDSSPALAGEQLFLRGEKHLYCISE